MSTRSIVAVLFACCAACDAGESRAAIGDAPDGPARPPGEVQVDDGWEGRCPPAPPGPFAGSLDQKYLAVASLEPAFAGVYVSDDGRLVTVLTDLARVEPAACALVAVLGGGLVAEYGPPSAVRGTYGWAELYEWKLVATGALVEGITFVDIDELRNRIAIGVWPQGRTPEVEEALVTGGIPREAMILEVEPPPGFY